MEIGSGHNFWEFSSIGNEVEQLASAYVLQNDGKAFISRFILFFISGSFSDVNETDEVLMIKIFHNTELMLEDSEVGCFFFIFLNGYVVAIFVLSEFDSKNKLRSYWAW